MAVHIPSSIYQKLLIAPQYDVPKKVVFSDMNPVKTFHYNDPPATISDTPEVARLKARIQALEMSVARRDARIHSLSVSNVDLITALGQVDRVAAPKARPPQPRPQIVAKPRKPNKHANFFRNLGRVCVGGLTASVVLSVFFPPAGIPLAVVFGLLSLSFFGAASE